MPGNPVFVQIQNPGQPIDHRIEREPLMETICIKTSDFIEAEALKLFLDEFKIPTVLTPMMDGIVSSLGSESRFFSLLVLRQYLPQVITALKENSNELVTSEELQNLENQLNK